MVGGKRDGIAEAVDQFVTVKRDCERGRRAAFETSGPGRPGDIVECGHRRRHAGKADGLRVHHQHPVAGAIGQAAGAGALRAAVGHDVAVNKAVIDGEMQ